MKLKRRIINLVFMLLGIFSTTKANFPIKANAASDKIPDAANYLRLDGQYTDQAWITKDVGTVYKEGVRTFNHIVFFNTNPAWNIVSVEHINYEIKLPNKTMPDAGQVSNSQNYHMRIKTDRKYRWFDPTYGVRAYPTYDVYPFTKASDSEQFIAEGKIIKQTPVGYSHWYITHYEFNFPQLGKTQNIKELFQTARDARENLDDYVIYFGQNDRKGFDTYTSMINEFGSNYEYYLILPIESSNKVTVNYLSLTATDVNGNIISDDAGIGEAQIDTNTGDEFFTFDVVKNDGLMETNTAFYFPRSNRYKLTGLKVTNYSDNNEEQDYAVVFYAGNVIGKTSLKDVADNVKYVATLKNDGNYLQLNYLFNGDNNCILFDIAEEIVSATITVRFVELNTDQGEVLKPFGLNLLDNNGYYGIRGELALDNRLNEELSLWDRFKNRLKNLFDFSSFGFTNPLDTISSIFKIALLVSFAALIIYVGFKIGGLIRVASKKKKVRRR